MMKYMRTIEFYYPNITKIVRLGTTHEGKPIEGMKVSESNDGCSKVLPTPSLQIGYPISSNDKRAIWIDGNIHAREWASSHTALFFINQVRLLPLPTLPVVDQRTSRTVQFSSSPATVKTRRSRIT